jgi:hypothetical protein
VASRSANGEGRFRVSALLVALSATLRTALRLAGVDDDAEAESEGLKLARRVIASDVSQETLDRLERAGCQTPSRR